MLLSNFSQPARAQTVNPSASMDHVAISVADLSKSAEFYKEVFGFREVPAPVPMARWLVMDNGVMLHIVGNRKAPSSHDRWDHMALRYRDLTALIAKLDAQHIRWTNMEGGQQAQIRGDGVKQIFVQDPDGYWIEINDASMRR
jgi:lactoylglutathione lyase